VQEAQWRLPRQVKLPWLVLSRLQWQEQAVCLLQMQQSSVLQHWRLDHKHNQAWLLVSMPQQVVRRGRLALQQCSSSRRAS
jgi:hypothetical protein